LPNFSSLQRFAKFLKFAAIFQISQVCSYLPNFSRLQLFAKFLKFAGICQISQLYSYLPYFQTSDITSQKALEVSRYNVYPQGSHKNHIVIFMQL
jgi:hypothetical protein